MTKLLRLAALLTLALALGGCAGIAKGVTQAILESGDDEDTRACHVEGPASKGLEASLRKQESDRAQGNASQTLKVLMVHGISRHIPGYSGRLTANLMGELGLDVREEDSKEITLRDAEIWDEPLGHLRISRFMNKARTRELIFYELTWSDILDPERDIIAFDDSQEYAFRRTGLNSLAKKFFNATVPDSLAYLGGAQQPILASVRQSVCWMTQGDWADYPPAADRQCNVSNRARLQHLAEDDYAFITHSLGSRIVVDTVQFYGEWVSKEDSPDFAGLKATFRTKEMPVYMLANQLPLLQIGRKPAAVNGKIADYCRPDGRLYDQRILGKLPIYAFSDPNDILSYPIPPKFVDEYSDSRLCPKVTNIAINVAKPFVLFGLGEGANPTEAHSGYDHDDRVIALIAHGIGHDATAPVVTERCTWLETTESE